MKKLFFLHLLTLISIYSANAQETINLNSESHIQYKEINLSENSDLNFEKAERLRKIVLNSDIQTDKQIHLNDTIELDLFHDKQYKGVVEKVYTDVNGTLLVRAKLIGYNYSYCFVSTFEGKTFLTVEIPENNELFMSKYDHFTNTYYLMLADNAKLEELEEAEQDVHLDHNHIIEMVNNDPVILQSPTTMDTITLLIVYTPNAAAWSTANEVNINNTISLMMAKADLATSNSNTLLYIELAHSQQVNYTELQSGQDLSNLRGTSDGNMDTVHVLRDAYCADLVTLLEQTSHTGGSAYLLTNTNGSPNFGFSIIRVQQASWTYTGVHEFGHNLGCGHHKDQNVQAGPGIFSYSAGGRWVSVPNGDYCSVMSYTSGSYYVDGVSHTRVPHFSNPVILYQGTSTGDAVDADNARSIRNTKTAVAGYRSTCTVPDPVMVSGDGGVFCDSVVLSATGGARGTIYWQGTTSGGTSFATSSNSQTITTSGTYYFRAHNFVGWGPEGSATVVIDSIPSPAGVISGPTTVCQGQLSQMYTVPTITNTISYIWTLPSGIEDTIISNNITIDYSNSAVSGNIIVKGNNLCGDGVSSSLSIVVDPLPASAGVISGSTTVCQGQLSETYTIPAISDATSYVWTLPTGVTGASSTNSITIDYGITSVSGNITVKGVNSCGDGGSSSLPIVVDPLPNNSGTISGLTTVCQGQSSEIYTVPVIANATSYVWTLPTGATGISSTNSITVDYGNAAVSGNITVKGVNSCGDGVLLSLPIMVDPLPVNAGTISGPTTVCQGQLSVTYTVPIIAYATSYIWTFPTGAAGTSATRSITVNYSDTAISGNITVKGVNACGGGVISSLPIVVNPKPATPVITGVGNILNSDAVSGNQWYNQNGTIIGETDQELIAIVEGDYYVIVTLLGCSSEASNTISVSFAGIGTTDYNDAIIIFPNPISSQLTVEIDDNDETVKLEILNSAGQLVYSDYLISKKVINTSDFATGIYLIKLKSDSIFEIRKVIKE